jgi:ABC-type antimicrobial peptide transport system permease subunit
VTVAHANPSAPAPTSIVLFTSHADKSIANTFLLSTVASEVRRTVRDVLKTAQVGQVITLADQVAASIVPERLIAALSACFGALGSLFTAIGLYGLLAYTVARRANEIGIRMALGASRNNVARMVLSDALMLVLAGLVLGVPIALWSKRFAASLIQDLPVNSTVPIAFGGLAMIAIALVAAYIPARRAFRVARTTRLRNNCRRPEWAETRKSRNATAPRIPAALDKFSGGNSPSVVCLE